MNTSASSSLRQTLLKRISIALLLFAVPVTAFVGLANEIKEANPLPGDLATLHALHHLSSPLLDTLFLIITTLGSAGSVIVVLVALIAYLLRHKHRRDALFLATAVGGAAALDLTFKLLFHRARPSLWHQIITEKGYSFPSGHAMVSCSLALTIMIICWPTRWRRVAIIGGTIYFVLVGISRLYLGVHYPSDVVGGWCVSIAWIYLVHRVFGIFSPTKQPESEAQPIEASVKAPVQP